MEAEVEGGGRGHCPSNLSQPMLLLVFSTPLALLLFFCPVLTCSECTRDLATF